MPALPEVSRVNRLSLYFKLAAENIKKNRRIYFPYMLSAIGTIMMYYIIVALPESMNTEDIFGGETAASFLSIGANVIMVFAAIFLFYTNSFIIKRRKKELGLYNILGMQKKNIAGIITLETLMVAFLSIVIGLILGIVFNKLMFMLLAKLIGAEEQISFTISQNGIILSLILFVSIFAVTLLYNLLQIVRAKPIDLLHGGEFGEKEPKANWFVAILGVILLGVGYYISLTIVSPVEAMLLFFVAVILVILGTYLLFISGMTVFLKVLRKNKGYYYKSKHFTTVSGMLYRMKQNAAGLATICILSTCVLVMISTTFSMYTSVDSVINSRFPRDLALEVDDTDEASISKIEALVNEEIAKYNAEVSLTNEFVYTEADAHQEGSVFTRQESAFTEETSFLFFLPQEEFVESAGQELNLAEDEVAIQLVNTSERFESITLAGREFRVKYVDGFIFTGADQMTVSNNFIVFTHDLSLAEELATALTNYIDVVRPYSYYYGFNVSGGRQIEEDLHLALKYVFDSSELSNAENRDSPAINYASYRIGGKARESEDALAMYGSFFFLGIFLGLMFIMALVLIIYYKQVTEGYDDKRRFEIMQNVGMSHAEVRKSIHSQILLVFFIPLAVALIHLVFAMPILMKILSVMYLTNTSVIILSTVGVALVFALVYTAVYFITARTYYKIVEA